MKTERFGHKCMLVLGVFVAVLHLAALHGPASATTYLNDGGTHDVSGPSEDIWVSNATTLNVQPGSAIQSPILSAGIVVADQTAIVNVLGGSVRGGDNLGVVGQHGGVGIEGSGSVYMLGGIVLGANSIGPGTGVGGGGVFIVGGTVVVEGGEILGGDHTGGGFFGGFALGLRDASGSVSGGTLVGGGGDAPGAAVRLQSGATLDITGGSFSGRFDLWDGSVLNVYGSDLDFSGNSSDLLTGVLSDGTPISVQVFPQPGAQINLIPALTPETLADLVNGLGLPSGVESSLTPKLDRAQESLDRGQTRVAINQLKAFINQVNALSGKKLDEADAEALVEQAETLIARLGDEAAAAPSPAKKGAAKPVVELTSYPNPSNPATTIRYTLARDAEVELSIFNLLGQRVRQLAWDRQTSGLHNIRWDGTDARGRLVTSGIYLIRITAGAQQVVHKVMLLK